MLNTAVLLAASVVVGQAQQPSAYEHMKIFDWMIGTSVGEYELPEGQPEMGPAGAKVVRRVSAKWALNKSAVIFTISNSINGVPEDSWMELAHWNPKDNCIAHWILTPGGSSSTGVWSQDGKQLILKWSVALSDGVELAGTGRMHPTGPGTYVWQITDCTKNGEKIPDIPEVKFNKEERRSKRATK